MIGLKRKDGACSVRKDKLVLELTAQKEVCHTRYKPDKTKESWNYHSCSFLLFWIGGPIVFLDSASFITNVSSSEQFLHFCSAELN